MGSLTSYLQINDADILRFGRLDEIDPSVWEKIMRTNAFAPWRFMVAVLPEI